MGKLFGSSKTTSTSTSTSQPWKVAIPMLEKALNSATELFDEQGGINSEWIDKELADLTPEMQQSVKDLISSSEVKDSLKSASEAAKSGLSGIESSNNLLQNLAKNGINADQINDMSGKLYDSTLVQSQIDQVGKDVRDQLGASIKGINQNATASGNMGSSRAGVAEGVAKGKAADAIAEGSANIQNSARQSAMNQAMSTLQGNQQTSLNAANQLGSLGVNSAQLQQSTANGYNQTLQNQLTGSGILQNQAQNVANNNWINKVGDKQAGWDALSNYTNIVGGIGGMGGTSSGTATQGGGGNSLFNNILGAGSTIAGMGNSFGWWSDASMKKDVKKTGNMKDGTPTYKWKWNESAKKQGMKGSSKGVLAQDVAKRKPDAVKREPKSGRLQVDYSALG